MAANLHASFVLFSYGVWNEYQHEGLVVVMVIATSFLMISNLPYEKAHFFGPKLIFRSPIGWLVLLTVVVGFWVPEVVIFPYALYFVLGGLLRGLFKTYSARLRAAWKPV
jgi:phosphatidylserine synthase